MNQNGSLNINSQYQNNQNVQNNNNIIQNGQSQINNNEININKNIDNNIDNPSDNKKSELAKGDSKDINKNIIIGNEMSVEYENALREQIQLTTPLISEILPINSLLDDYKNNNEYLNSIKEITNKYKSIRKVRRDGNCFYRSFIYRLFEYICMKNNQNLYNQIKKKITDAKDLIERNGYDWTFIKDNFIIHLIVLKQNILL